MKKIDIIYLALLLFSTGLIQSCKEEDSALSEAIVTSLELIEFNIYPVGARTITVTSDGDWSVESPDWIEISPTSGHSGRTKVQISVSDNVRDKLPDNPRKHKIVFKGLNSWAQAFVTVSQSGDKFRDIEDSTPEQFLKAEDETVIRLTDMIVAAGDQDGFICTDGTTNIYVSKPVKEVNVGDKVNVCGDKGTDDVKFPFLLGEIIDVTGTSAVPHQEAIDITDLDNCKINMPKYATVDGVYNGTSVKVGDNLNQIFFQNVGNVNIWDFAGHIVRLKGFYMGTAAPAARFIPTEIESLGLNETIYFVEDFEWLEPWGLIGETGDGSKPAGDIFPEDMYNATSPQISTPKMIYNGMTACQALEEKGYRFLRAQNTDAYVGDENATECIYLMKNYLKFGKTDFQGGIILPPLQELEDKEDVVMTFNWCPSKKKNGTVDPTCPSVFVENNGIVKEFKLQEHGWEKSHKFHWLFAEVHIAGVDKNTKITIRSNGWLEKDCYRFFLDNIKIKKEE